MKLILMGYRGSGKTSVGRDLARRLGLPFCDVDQQTRQRFDGATIAQIWAEQGEPAWRTAEAQVTAETCSGPDAVIALGGGTVMIPDARQAVATAGDAIRVYLCGSAELLYERIRGDAGSGSSRPALTDMDGGIAEVRAVLEERDPTYRATADVVIDLAGKSVGQVADAVMATLADQ